GAATAGTALPVAGARGTGHDRLEMGQLVGGRFELGRLAASGGFGAVYRARDRERNAPAAVKILHGQNAGRVQRFEREAAILADLRHPAIVEYLAHGRTGGNKPFLAMEWLEGEDLSAALARRGPLPLAEAMKLAERVAGALAVAHARGVVHRDLKPSNIFLP